MDAPPSYARFVVVPRAAIVSLILTLSPVGAVACELACLPSLHAGMHVAVETAADGHHGDHSVGAGHQTGFPRHEWPSRISSPDGSCQVALPSPARLRQELPGRQLTALLGQPVFAALTAVPATRAGRRVAMADWPPGFARPLVSLRI